MSQEAELLFESLLSANPNPQVETQFPFYPLTAPGMPLPGPNFLAAAINWGESVPPIEGKGDDKRITDCGPFLSYLYRRALYDCDFRLNVELKGQQLAAKFVPGHLWDSDTRDLQAGPRPSDVLVLGKNPGLEEVNMRRNFVGPTSEELSRALQELGLTDADYGKWYITNLVKFPNLNPQTSTLTAKWVKDCEPLLAEELRLVRPRFILCLGSEASKHLLGTPYNVSSMVGRVMDYRFPIHDWGEAPAYHTCKVMTATHPAAVYRTPELYDTFIQQLGLFWQLVNGGDVGNEEQDVDHALIWNERQLSRCVDRILAEDDPESRFIAVDAEWDRDYPTEEGAYLRTVQFSHKEKFARQIILRYQGGAPAFKPSIERAVFHLKRLLKSTPERQVRIGGHFLRSDMPWLIDAGLDLRAEYELPEDPEDRHSGGWDTSLAYHAYNETARYKLEDVATRLTTAPRYDVKLQKWRQAYCSARKLKAEDLEGYGECPDKILCGEPAPERHGRSPYPGQQVRNSYGCYDADVTRRIAKRLFRAGGLLDRDWRDNNCWQPYWVSHRASLAFLEMEMTGFVVDRDRADEISALFMEAKGRLLAELRADLNWPTFNPGSDQQRVAMLFGDEYSKKIDKATGQKISVRPPGAVTLDLKPVKSTSKPPKLWADLVARRQAFLHSPSADKEVLGILGRSHPVAFKLRDVRFISQVLQSVLRPPAQTETGEFDTDENGNYIYEKGLVGSLHRDGRVRTHLFQTKETGRASSARFALQNLSKRREDDYRRIIGPENHKHPIRSILSVPPGYVGIEADLVGAELAVLAWLCQDQLMIDHVRRNGLPESDPDHYDIHSRQACAAFNLDCEPTKTGMKLAGKPGLRVAAKNVNFGIPYGRGAEAIQRQCAEEGVIVSVAETQLMIDAYFERYTRTADFLEECRRLSQDPGWMVNPLGRYRRFIHSADRQVIGEQERQAQNFPIQSTVADAVSRALDALYHYRDGFDPSELTYKILLQVHDAILVLVPTQFAERVYREVLPACMCGVEIWPRHLDGSPMPQITQPYHFDIDREVFTHWGEKLKDEEARALGLDWAIAA